MSPVGLAFLLTTLNARLKAKGFAVSARELEAAIARNRFDDELPERYLAQAEVLGIEILNRFDSKKGAVRKSHRQHGNIELVPRLKVLPNS